MTSSAPLGRRAATLLAVLALVCTAVACTDDDTIEISSIGPQTTYVGEFLRVPFTVKNKGLGTLELGYSGPDLPFLDRYAFVIPRGSGGEFQWTPTSDHVGEHTFTINAAAGERRTSRRFSVEVVVAREAAPVFISPPVGVALDTTVDPCVDLAVSAVDRDSAAIELEVAFGLPVGATFAADSAGNGTFRWCPAPDQIAAARQWVVTFAARDAEHAPVLRDLFLVLVDEPKEPCGGSPPAVRWLSPEDGSALISRVGYDVVLEVQDDQPLRDAPILFYTDGRVEQRDQLELENFFVAPFERSAEGQWTAHLPTFRLAEDEAKNLSLVAFVSDDDDPNGTRCDNLAELRLRRFTAIGAVEAGILEDCATCQVSGDCLSGVCARTAFGGRCIPACDLGETCAGDGECGLWNSMEGVVRTGCGPAEGVCLGLDPCAPDRNEPNDTPETAVALGGDDSESGIACERDDDWFRLEAASASPITLATTGAVELQVIDERGVIVGVGARTDVGANVEICPSATGRLLVRVFAPTLQRSEYTLTVSPGTGTCSCSQDSGEAEDAAGRPLAAGAASSGVICGSDVDVFAVSGDDDSRFQLRVDFDPRQVDIDVDVIDADGDLVGRSDSVADVEALSADLTTASGPYRVRVYSYDASSGAYEVSLASTALEACADGAECRPDEVCRAGRCRRELCTRNADCSIGLICPLVDRLAGARTCVPQCEDDQGCAEGRSCKRFFEGSACIPPGSLSLAAPCERSSDCSGQAVCIDWPGGHCAAAGCDVGPYCEPGSGCAMVDGRAACVQTCWVSDNECQRTDGYDCRELFEPDGEIVYGCVPGER